MNCQCQKKPQRSHLQRYCLKNSIISFRASTGKIKNCAERQRVLQKKLIQEIFPSPHPNQKKGGTQGSVLTKQPNKAPSPPLSTCRRESKVPTRQPFKAATCNRKCGSSSSAWVGREAQLQQTSPEACHVRCTCPRGGACGQLRQIQRCYTKWLRSPAILR